MTNNQRWFDKIDDKLQGVRLAEELKAAWEKVEAAADQSEDGVFLPQADLELLFDLSEDKNKAVSNAALNILIEEIRARCEYGPLTWDDLEVWTMNEEEDIRHEAIFAVGTENATAKDMCEKDKPRCTALLGSAVEEYLDHSADAMFWSLSRNSNDWLDATWSEVGRLLDLNRSEITEMLTSGYLEDLLTLKSMGIGDNRINSWVNSDKTYRKLALLTTAGNIGLTTGKVLSIVEALSKDKDEQISDAAKALLNRN